MLSEKKTFSIVVPVYQNQDNLGDTIPKLLQLQAQIYNYNLELIFVDDGSTDNSYKILNSYYKQYLDKIKVIKLTKNFGQNNATCAGLKYAKGSCVGIISADLQDPQELFVEMIKKWESGIKLIIAVRQNREESFVQKFISNLYWRLVRKFALNNYPLGGYDFCLLDHQVVAEVNKINEKNSHIFILIFSLGYHYFAIPYTRKKRTAGKSQWSLSMKVKLFIDTFISFSYAPIRGISYLGVGIAIISFILGLIVAISKFIYGNNVEGWTTIVVLLCFFGGLILLTLGIIGEYIWRILRETGKRPNFVVDKVLMSENQFYDQ